MSNSKNKDNFFISIDDIDNSSNIFIDDEVDNSSDVFIGVNTSKDTQKNNDEFIFVDDTPKINEPRRDNINSSQNDYFIKIDNGDIIDQNKEKNELYIMKEKEEVPSENIPHYNSPEYAEYMSKLNKDSLKEISTESINNDSITHKIKEDATKKYGKEKIQKILFVSIIVLFIASVITFGFMLKGSNNVSNNRVIGTNSSQGDIKDFDFLLKVIISSNQSSLEYFNELKSIAENKNTANHSIQNIKIEKILESIKVNLEEVESLGNYINTRSYMTEVNLLKKRYENLTALCNTLISSKPENAEGIYNKAAKYEMEVIDSLNVAIIDNLNKFNIKYRIENDNIVLD